MEATKPFKHSGKRPLQGVRECAGHNMSEHRVSFEKGNADADPVEIRGRLASSGKNTLDPGPKDVTSGKCTGGVRRSSGDGMRARESQRNTGSPPRWGQVAATGTPRGADRAGADGGEARSSEEAGNDRRAKGPQFQGNVNGNEEAEIGASLAPPRKLQEMPAALHAKAKGSPPVGERMNRPWSESRMREICLSGLTSGEWKRSGLAATAPLLDSTSPDVRSNAVS